MLISTHKDTKSKIYLQIQKFLEKVMQLHVNKKTWSKQFSFHAETYIHVYILKYQS